MTKDGTEQGCVINAAAVFAVKAELAERQTKTEEAEHMRNIVGGHVATYAIEIENLSPELASIINPKLKGMTTKIIDIKADDNTTSERANESGYQVVESSTDDVLLGKLALVAQPNRSLMISTDAISAMHTIIEPMFAAKVEDELTSENHFRAAVAMTIWMALGKWTFDEVNPRLSGDLNTDQQLALLLCLDKFKPDILNDNNAESVENRLDMILFYIKRRFAGALAYSGLVSTSMDGEVSHTPSALELIIFQPMYKKMIDTKNKLHQGTATAMELSVANPFTRQELKTISDFFANSRTHLFNDFDASKVDLTF